MRENSAKDHPALIHRCPFCSADPGTPCLTRSGRELAWPHNRRCEVDLRKPRPTFDNTVLLELWHRKKEECWSLPPGKGWALDEYRRLQEFVSRTAAKRVAAAQASGEAVVYRRPKERAGRSANPARYRITRRMQTGLAIASAETWTAGECCEIIRIVEGFIADRRAAAAVREASSCGAVVQFRRGSVQVVGDNDESVISGWAQPASSATLSKY